MFSYTTSAQWFQYENNCSPAVLLLNLVCLKTLSPISEKIKATVLSKLSKLSERYKCSECQLKLVSTEIGIERDYYLQQLFRGGTTSTALRDFIFQTFRIIDFISPTIETITKNVYVQSVSEGSLLNPGYISNFITKSQMKNLRPGLS